MRLDWRNLAGLCVAASIFVGVGDRSPVLKVVFSDTFGTAMAQSAATIREIRVEGAQRIEPETVRSYMGLAVGDPFDAGRVNQALKNLFGTGLFADVRMRRDGGALVVAITENPVINRIAIEGNERISDEDLTNEIELRPRVVYTPSRVQQDVTRIEDVYRRSGRFGATVEPKIIQLDQNRVDLVFEVSEGRPTGIRRITFVGNRKFSDSSLRGVIQTSESKWWDFFSASDTYDPDRLTFDRELLRRFYLQEGYADFQVVSAVAELTPDREDFVITFTIEEGERYKFGNINITALLRDIDVEGLREHVDTETGDWYDAEKIEKTISALTDEVGTLGYAFVDIRPRTERDEANRLVNITYEIGEGPKVFVERIDIIGNVRTEDRVVRREFRLVEGDAFNTSKLRRSRQRIENLGFFSKVQVANVPGSTSDRTVVKVEVEEQSTGELSFGIGFSTLDGPLGDVSIRERNLLGKGQDLSLSFTGSGRTQQIDLSFTEPYFLGRPLSTGFDVFRRQRDNQDESSFDEEEFGFRLRMGYAITEEWSQSWRYALRNVEIKDVDSDASLFVQSQAGENLISEIGQTLAYDKRDNRFSPTDGYFGRLSTDVAGLGGDITYLRNRVDGAYYYPLTEDVIFSATGEAGYIVGLGEDVRLSDRFFIGGTELRGFGTSGIGPRDSSTNDALGGEIYYVGSLEANFPLGLPEELGIRGRVFADAGSLLEVSDDSAQIDDTGSLRASVGVGLGWRSPFGPINIDFAFPFLKEDFDETESIRISFGTNF